MLLAANDAAGPIEREAVTFDSLRGAAQFNVPRFMSGCVRLFRSVLGLGLVLVLAYAAQAPCTSHVSCTDTARPKTW